MSSAEQDSGFNIVPYERRNDLDLDTKQYAFSHQSIAIDLHLKHFVTE
jgi:hypothetical protein